MRQAALRLRRAISSVPAAAKGNERQAGEGWDDSNAVLPIPLCRRIMHWHDCTQEK